MAGKVMNSNRNVFIDERKYSVERQYLGTHVQEVGMGRAGLQGCWGLGTWGCDLDRLWRFIGITCIRVAYKSRS